MELALELELAQERELGQEQELVQELVQEQPGAGQEALRCL